MKKVRFSTSIPCQLVRIMEPTQHPLHGLLFRASGKAKRIVVHSHGTLGNFYFNPFLDDFASVYVEHGISFFSFNHVAHDAIAESVLDGEVRYVGGSIASFHSCVDDFRVVVKMLVSMGFDEIVLQGHSLGCERVIYFQRGLTHSMPTILLSPVNSRATQEAWCQKILGIDLTQLIMRLELAPHDQVLHDVYGSYSADPKWNYYIPITPSALLTFLKSPAIDYFDIERSILRSLINTLVIVPKHDAFSAHSPHTMQEFFEGRLVGSSKLVVIEDEHEFLSQGKGAAGECAEWVSSLLF